MYWKWSRRLNRRISFIVTMIFAFSILAMRILYKQGHKYVDEINCFDSDEENGLCDRYYRHGRWRNLSKEQISKLSNLGKILFLEQDYPKVNAMTKNYTILIWRYGWAIDRRHIQRYSNSRFNPLDDCIVKNCKISYNDDDLAIADLVTFELYFLKSPSDLPQGLRNSNQIWTFVTDESPLNTYAEYWLYNQYPNFDGYFNWSLTYRMDSDIPVPYGRTVAYKPGERKKEFSFEEWNRNKNQDILITILGSHCYARNNRWHYVKLLQKYIRIDKFGTCGRDKCPGRLANDCKLLHQYKFYLAFENSNCNEYITEKLWWNSFEKEAIPIIMGSKQEILNQILPPNSYIHTDNFLNPKDLADYIIYLNSTSGEMKKYLNWKNHFRIVNDHGYFQSKSAHYCRMCEALNFNRKKPKVYEDLDKFWFKNYCQRGWTSYFGEYLYFP